MSTMTENGRLSSSPNSGEKNSKSKQKKKKKKKAQSADGAQRSSGVKNKPKLRSSGVMSSPDSTILKDAKESKKDASYKEDGIKPVECFVKDDSTNGNNTDSSTNDSKQNGVENSTSNDEDDQTWTNCSFLSEKIKESLRWECQYDDPEKEEERIELYKRNRRQRYLEAYDISEETHYKSSYYA